MKNFLIFSLCLTLLTACEAPVDETITVDPAPEVPEETEEVESALLYTNSEYGFTLDFPEEWEGYQVSERTLEWGEIGTTPSYDFGFEDTYDYPGDGIVSLMNVSVFTKDQWIDIITSGDMMPGYLGENETYVFAAGGSQDAPEELDDQRMLVEDILFTFELAE